MGRRAVYRQVLQEHVDWESFLLANTGLPGPRANLELVHAVADLGDEVLFLSYLSRGEPGDAQHPETLLVMCGLVGLGRLTSEGSDSHWQRLRDKATDTRWRVREAVAMALQRVGRMRFADLIAHTYHWASDVPLVQRALVAGVCEPDILEEAERAQQVFAVLDRVMGSVVSFPDRRDEGFRVLRQALGYCWSVAVAQQPAEGWPLMEAWCQSADADVRWIMRSNLAKKRLLKTDPARLATLRAGLYDEAR